MSGFSSQWLALREPVDHAARSDEVISAVAHYFLNDNKLTITDIGSGTGSTLRALKPVLQQDISWHLIDHDETLIDVARSEAKSDEVNFSLADLSKSLEELFVHNPKLLTTSAFLDLVSETWLQEFVDTVAAHQVPFYAALTYDGRAGCDPETPDDKLVAAAFNQHQKTDKGFGPALGPDAADTAISMFKKAGYQVIQAQSDWIGDKNHKEFQKMLLEGWSSAATEIAPENSEKFSAWLQERLHLIENENATVFVGHQDFLAVPE